MRLRPSLLLVKGLQSILEVSSFTNLQPTRVKNRKPYQPIDLSKQAVFFFTLQIELNYPRLAEGELGLLLLLESEGGDSFYALLAYGHAFLFFLLNKTKKVSSSSLSVIKTLKGSEA